MDRSGESMNPKDKHADWLLKPTANELADIQAFKTEELTMWERNHTATMLRKQQVEIEALKAAKIRAYNNGVEDGRKPDTNNKPVAWINKESNITMIGGIYPKKLEQYLNGLEARIFALETHPVKEQDESFDRTASHMAGEYVSYQKELTDEEIIKVYEDMLGVASAKGSAIDFARAILRKAQEK